MYDPPRRERLDLLDLWRSAAVVLMLVYHGLFDLAEWGLLSPGLLALPVFDLVRILGAGSFILISGFSAGLSRNPLRRGCLTLGAAALVSLVSALAGKPILFGVLHLLGCCTLLAARLRKPRAEAAPALLALFCLTAALLPRLRVPFSFLFPLGLVPAGFVSWDFYPLLPWGFLYFAGTSVREAVLGRMAERRVPRSLTFFGRHSLAVYLLHQPLYYGCYGLFRLLSGYFAA